MKVGTDGCLLGAWATAENPKQILDIGSGTGLISLMLAQRFPTAQIDAIEIEKACAQQAQENVQASPWHDRVSVSASSIQDFESEYLYDLIVSNPPYFTNAFAAPNETRHQARHDDTLSAHELISHTKRLLAPEGVFCLIIPTDRFTEFEKFAAREHLHLVDRVNVHPTPSKPAKRLLLKYSTVKREDSTSTFFIEKERGQYSDAFTKLLQDFYLYL